MLTFFKQIKEFLYPINSIKLIIILGSMILGAVLELIGIGVIMLFVSLLVNIESNVSQGYLGDILSFFNIKNSKEILIYGSIFIFLIFLLKNTYLIFQKYIKNLFVYNRYRNISQRLFLSYIKAPYSFHLNKNSADLVRNIMIESERIASDVIMPFLQIITEFILIVSISIMLMIVEPFITFFSIVFLGGISFLFIQLSKKKISIYGSTALYERRRLMKITNESIGGIKDIIITNKREWFINNFNKNIRSLLKSRIFQQTIEQGIRPSIETIAVLGMIFISFILFLEGRPVISLLPTLTLFAFSIYRFLPSLNNIINDYVKIKYYSDLLSPVYKDLERLNKEKNNKDNKKISFKNKLELKNVSYKYSETKKDVLKDINLTIFKGKAVGIIGETGSGKTTLVDIIAGFLEPINGEIIVDGIDIKNNIESWQENIGYISQFIYLSDDTIYKNIAFGLEEEEINKERVLEVIKIASLKEFVESLPNGINTIIGERGVRLSGGQRQRIGIARALYNDPKILIMDEATSSLDTITEKYIIEAIEKIKKERTIITIAHRLSTVKNCDILYVIKEGKIVDSGTYQELLKKNEYFKTIAK